MTYSHVKRCVDIIVSAAALVVCAPILIVVALIIYLDDGLPTIFRQTRSGAGRVPFTVYKFRSMPNGTANKASGEAAALKVTRIGRLIRRLNLDELPQLFNILKGDMSLVGPRPAIPEQESLLKMRDDNGSSALTPGLTGLAQVNSFDGMTDEEKSYFDGLYVERFGLVQDLKIIFATFGYLLKRPPVY